MTCYCNIQIQHSFGAYPRIITNSSKPLISFLDVHFVRKGLICTSEFLETDKIDTSISSSTNSTNLCLNKTKLFTYEDYNKLLNKVIFNRFENKWFLKFFEGSPVVQLAFIILELLKDTTTIVDKEVVIDTEVVNEIFKPYTIKEWNDEDTNNALRIYVEQGILENTVDNKYKVLTEEFTNGMLFRYIDKLSLLK